MAAIPEGGRVEVEWGVRHQTTSGDHVVRASREEARERLAEPHIPDCVRTVVAREVTYGPWLEMRS